MTHSFSIKIGEIELRSNPSGKGNAEIVRWTFTDSKNGEDKKPYCYVVAFIEPKKEGADFVSVGLRPWKEEDLATVWTLGKFGIELIEKLQEMEE